MFSDSKFWDSTRITLLYVVYNIPLQTILGKVIAVIADRVAKSVVVRIIIIAPYLISGVVATMVWVLMLDPLLGMTDAFLHMIGVPPQPFFNTPDQAIMSVAGVSIWRYVGFTALLFYAGLQSVPRNLYEAAKIDGASEVKMFFDITIPLRLRPVLAFVLVTSVIGSFQIPRRDRRRDPGRPGQLDPRAALVHLSKTPSVTTGWDMRPPFRWCCSSP